MSSFSSVSTSIEERMLLRNQIIGSFFAAEASRLAEACREMAQRFLRGGRLIAFGSGPYATDAQHVSVEFVHPVIVGKRALPALDLSIAFGSWLDAIVVGDDMVMGFGPPEGDVRIWSALNSARARNAMTFALPGPRGSYCIPAPADDPFIHQECIEILYHTLWETVHVFFERRELGHDAGEASFLYPFLGRPAAAQPETALLQQVAESIRMKVEDDAQLRTRVAHEEADRIRSAIRAIHEHVGQGGKLIVFGNGGSATDANDLAIDCVSPPRGYRPVPAISLSLEPAIITAIANDVGEELVFLRQLIAHARAGDVAIAISTSGGSRNIIAALEEARKRRLLTVALLGYDGGETLRQGLADFPIVVRSDYIPRIQEVQASIYHCLREGLELLNHGSL